MTKRFDESVFPTLDEIRERCLRAPNEAMGVCRDVYQCVVAKVLFERAPKDVAKISVNPSTITGMGEVRFWWGNFDENWFDYEHQQVMVLPEELNALANNFDLIGAGNTVTGREVVPICDRIIAERKVAA